MQPVNFIELEKNLSFIKEKIEKIDTLVSLYNHNKKEFIRFYYDISNSEYNSLKIEIGSLDSEGKFNKIVVDSYDKVSSHYAHKLTEFLVKEKLSKSSATEIIYKGKKMSLTPGPNRSDFDDFIRALEYTEKLIKDGTIPSK